MRLYHATTKANFEAIEHFGFIEANESPKASNDVRLNGAFVYGFDNINDALDFMVWTNNIEMENVAILRFEVDDAVIDTEYNGNAYAVDYDVYDYDVVKYPVS